MFSLETYSELEKLSELPGADILAIRYEGVSTTEALKESPSFLINELASKDEHT